METQWQPDSMRASHEDRESTIRELNDAFSDGRLDLSELEDRVSTAYAAKTLGELRELTRDLPGHEQPTVAYPPHVPYQPAPQYRLPPAWSPLNPSVAGPPGTVRSPLACILLSFVTLGIYLFVWTFKTGKEMQRHSGSGTGGALLAFLFIPYIGWIITMIVLGSDVEEMFRRFGKYSRVSAATAWWALLPFIGAIVWFVKVQRQLNEYWRSL